MNIYVPGHIDLGGARRGEYRTAKALSKVLFLIMEVYSYVKP